MCVRNMLVRLYLTDLDTLWRASGGNPTHGGIYRGGDNFSCGGPRPGPATQNSALLERGRYLVEDASACGLCHTPRGADGRAVPGKALSGGRVMANDEYREVVPNITVDPETGTGRWSDLEIGAAIRDGRRPDESLIGPPMPMELYRGFSDRDVAAMCSICAPVQRCTTLSWSAQPIRPRSFHTAPLSLTSRTHLPTIR